MDCTNDPAAPRSRSTLLLPIVQKPGLKEAARVNLFNEVDNFIFIRDGDAMVYILNLVVIKLAGKGGDV